MRKIAQMLTILALAVFLSAGSAFAYTNTLDSGINTFGTEITIFDKNGDAPETGTNEDNEAEPGMEQTQAWDLEGFFLDENNNLSMIGGYDFLNGEAGAGTQLMSGDVFIDVTGDAQYGDIENSEIAGNQTVTDTFGYDYVLDMNFQDLTYDVYKLDADSKTITSYYAQNQGSNPWLYVAGGEFVESGSFNYQEGLTDAETGFSGWGTNSHNAVTGLDLGFIASDVPLEFTVHFTMECGNDNLMGRSSLAATTPGGGGGSAETPEPATMLLLGSGLVGIAGFRKRFGKKA